MPGWGKLVAGAVLGAAGVLYATNEEFRKQLPERARELPGAIGGRLRAARAAGREAAARRREEILRDLEAHGGDHTGRRTPETRVGASPDETAPLPPETRAGMDKGTDRGTVASTEEP